jgi:hypothetical protein
MAPSYLILTAITFFFDALAIAIATAPTAATPAMRRAVLFDGVVVPPPPFPPPLPLPQAQILIGSAPTKSVASAQIADFTWSQLQESQLPPADLIPALAAAQ